MAYYWGCEGLCLGACERMFRTGRVCLCVVVGRCGGEVFLEPVRGFCGGLECTEWVEKAWFAVRMLEWGCSAAICLGRSRVRGSMLVCGCRRVFCQPWRWQIVELPIVSRRHLDRYSLLFRSFFACSSFGSRSVFDRLTNKQRETNERRTRTEREVNGNRTRSDRETVVSLSGSDSVLNYLFCKHKWHFGCKLFVWLLVWRFLSCFWKSSSAWDTNIQHGSPGMQEFWHYLYQNLVIFNQNLYWFNINYNISIFTIPKSELFKPIF